MEHNSSSNTDTTTASQLRIPTAAWVILAAVVAALLAIFVFKVAVSTVLTYGFLGLMLFSHLFMHGGHGSHESHGTRTDQADSLVGDGTKTDQENTHARHGGCH